MTDPTLLFADRPVGSDADPLWEGHAIRDHLAHIAGTFVAPLASGQKAASLTVAVHGAWGSGKSSALCILRDLAIAKAPAEARDRLVFCEYAAPVWQSTRIDARTTLVARMLASLAGGVDKAVEELFLTAKAASSTLGDTPQPRDAEGRLVWSSATLSQIAGVLSRLQDFDALLARQILEDRRGPRVLVVLVDDLDRCDPSFVDELRSEVQQLGALPNLFFVLAADEATLRRAVQEGTPGRTRSALDTDHELAKLVQHTIRVPDLDERGASRLLARLFAGRDADPVAKALVDNADIFFQGLPEQTPRAVKRCLNALGYHLRAELSEPGLTPIDVQKRLKRALLEHTWDDFHRTYFVPMSRSAGHEREPLVALQGVLQRAGGGDRRIAHELAFLCEEFPNVAWQDLPVRLVRFLGTEPLLVDLSPSLASAQRGLPGGIRARGPRRASRSPTSGAPFTRSGEAELPDRNDMLPSSSSTDPGAGIGPDDSEPSNLPAGEPPVTADGLLAGALAAVGELTGARDRLDLVAHLVLDLAPFEPKSDGPAMTLGRAVLPGLARDPGDGALLAAVLDRYVTLLRRCGLLRLACKALHDVYELAPHVSYVRDAYAAYLVGAGAMDAARKVSANEAIDYHELLRDDPAGLKKFTGDATVRALAKAANEATPGA